VRWGPVLDRAAAIVESYDTLVTLRQLFYRLVSEQLIPNRHTAYKELSKLTAQARRDGWFPALFDRTRTIHVPPSWASFTELMAVARQQFRLDRTDGQPVTVVLGVEKHGLVELLTTWFGDRGLPVVALGGYSSQTHTDDVADYVGRQRRPAVLLYAGDFDPSGEDIARDFIARSDCWQQATRIALTPEQITEHDLPEMPGKTTDTRAAGFVARHGRLVQVEVDALPPDVLRDIYTDALGPWWDDDALTRVLDEERRQRDEHR